MVSPKAPALLAEFFGNCVYLDPLAIGTTKLTRDLFQPSALKKKGQFLLLNQVESNNFFLCAPAAQ